MTLDIAGVKKINGLFIYICTYLLCALIHHFSDLLKKFISTYTNVEY